MLLFTFYLPYLGLLGLLGCYANSLLSQFTHFFSGKTISAQTLFMQKVVFLHLCAEEPGAGRMKQEARQHIIASRVQGAVVVITIE